MKAKTKRRTKKKTMVLYGILAHASHNKGYTNKKKDYEFNTFIFADNPVAQHHLGYGDWKKAKIIVEKEEC